MSKPVKKPTAAQIEAAAKKMFAALANTPDFMATWVHHPRRWAIEADASQKQWRAIALYHLTHRK
jgi:hypothetical protein